MSRIGSQLGAQRAWPNVRPLASVRRGERWAGRVLLFAALAAGPAQAQVTLSRAPYLQLVSERGASIVWRTSSAAACTLGFAPPGGPTSSIVTPAGIEHVVNLSGLQAATRYDYTIRCGRLLAGGTDHFVRTAPAPGGSTVRFLAWGDSGEPTATQSAFAAMVNVQEVDLALLLGDIIYPDGRASYYDPRYFQVFAPLLRHTPAWAAPGNHDYPALAAYLDAWYLPTNSLTGSELFYSFDYGDIHFVSLDTNVSFSASVLDWLVADLDQTSRRWKIVFFHHTVYSCGSAHGSSTYLINLLGPIFEAHGVDLAIYGHDHDYERSFPMRARQVVDAAMEPDYVDPSGPIYVVGGAAAKPRSVSTSCTHTAYITSTPCVARVEVSGDLLTLEAVGTSGQVLDRMTLRKTGEPPPPPPPPPSASLLAPAGGETFMVGAALPIRWTTSAGVGPLRIELSRNGTSGPWETLFGNTANDGSETWTVTAPASSRCWLRLAEAANGEPADLTDAAFVIAATDTAVGPPVVPAAFNFQPEASPVPVGYVADTGLLFDAARRHGWAATPTIRARGVLANDPRDSFVEVANDATPAVWEFVLPDGHYRVALLCGDPTTTATHRVALEGQIVVHDEATAAGQFLERSGIPVLVRDGRLTVTLGGSGELTRTKLDAIVITAGAPEPHALLAPAGGERFCVGTSYTLRWSGATAGSLIRIDLSRNGVGGPWEPEWMTADDGEATLAAEGPAAAECVHRLVDEDGNVLAVGSTTFAIAEPHLALVTPNGGENWAVGSMQRFEWTSSCASADVRIEVSRDGPNGPWSMLFPSTPNDGYERWVVRQDDLGWTHARVLALPFELPNDASNSPFAVVESVAPTGTAWRIDFLPAGSLTAYGYEADAGQTYLAERGYGWDRTVSTKERQLLPGDCRDTFVQVTNNAPATWSLDLPNGDYLVSLVCGDPLTSGTHRVTLEGQRVVDDVYASGGSYVTRDDLPVTVNDGRLTVVLGGSSQITSTKLACLVAEPVAGRSGRPRRPHDVEPAGESTSLPEDDGIVVDGAPWRGPVGFTLELAQPANVQLTIHDVRGRRVAAVHSGAMPAGRHAFTWDPRDAAGTRLPSGVYFLRLTTPAVQRTAKLIVIR